MTIDAIPTAKPTVIRPANNKARSSANAIMSEPAMNKTSDAMIIGFRPNQSDDGPAIKDPKKAPSKASDTANSLSVVVISGHVSLK